MNTKKVFLVRWLILIVLVLLLALSAIQAVGTLWGRQMVTREIHSSAQNNVTYLRDTFEEILKKMDVKIYGEPGDMFDPNLHNAVMHVDDETLGENVIAQVFQKGFKIGDKVVRFAMVQVAN